MLLDAADTFWQDWVLRYDLNRQFSLVTRAERTGRSFSVDWLGRASAGLNADLRQPLEWIKNHLSGLIGKFGLD